MTQARSAVFRVNAEGFKKFSQPNWEVRFHLPIYDKRFGGLTYTGVTKLDVTSSEFQAETLANLEFNVNGANKVEGRAVVPHKFQTDSTYLDTNSYTIDDTEDYPNVPDDNALLGVMETALEFIDNTGEYNVGSGTHSGFSHMFRIGQEGLVGISDALESTVTSAKEYSLILPSQTGTFKFNKVAVFITNSETAQTFLFGILYFNTNIKKTKPALSSDKLTDIKFKFRVIMNADTNDQNVTDMDYDNYIFFNNTTSDFKTFSSNVISTTDSILSSDNLEGLKTDSDYGTVQNILDESNFISHLENASKGGFAHLLGFDGVSANKHFLNEEYISLQNVKLSHINKKGDTSLGLNRAILFDPTQETADIFDATSSHSSAELYANNSDIGKTIKSNIRGESITSENISLSVVTLFGASGFESTATNINSSEVNGYGLKLLDINESLVLGRCSTISARNSLVVNSFVETSDKTQYETSVVTLGEVNLSVNPTSTAKLTQDTIDYDLGSSYLKNAMVASSAQSLFSILSSDSNSLLEATTFNAMYTSVNGSASTSSINTLYSSLSGTLNNSSINSTHSSISKSHNSSVLIDNSVVDNVYNSMISIDDITQILSTDPTIVQHISVGDVYHNLGDTSTSDSSTKSVERFFFMNLEWGLNPNGFDFVVGEKQVTGTASAQASLIDTNATVMSGLEEINNSWFLHTLLISGATTTTDTQFTSSYQGTYIDGEINVFNASKGYIPLTLSFDEGGNSGVWLGEDSVLDWQNDFKSIWSGYELDAKLRKNVVVGVTAYNDVPLSTIDNLWKNDTTNNPSQDSLFSNGSSESTMYLYDIIQNVEYDTDFVKTVLTDGGKNSIARLVDITSLTYDSTAKTFTLVAPTSTSVSEISIGAESNTYTYNQVTAITQQITSLATNTNQYITLSLVQDSVTDSEEFEAKLVTFKIDTITTTSGVSIVMSPLSDSLSNSEQMSMFTIGNALADGETVVGKLNAVVWAVSDVFKAYLDTVWTKTKNTENIENKYVTSFAMGTDDFGTSGFNARYGVGRILRLGLLQSKFAKVTSWKSAYDANMSDLSLEATSVTKVDNSYVNTSHSKLGLVQDSIIVGNSIRVNPSIALNIFQYQDNGSIKFGYQKNSLQNSILMGKNINLNINPVNKSYIGNHDDGALYDIHDADADVKQSRIDWVSANEQSRLKNIYILGDSIHTFSGIYEWGNANPDSDGILNDVMYDSQLSDFFTDNSGNDGANGIFRNSSVKPLHGLRNSLIRGTEIFLSSTSGTLEEINLFGKYLNADHSWLTVFGRYNEWYNAELSNAYGNDFFVIANGRGTSIGGGLDNSGANYVPTSGFTRRYNMFVVTDRGITKTRTLISRGVAYRTNPSYQIHKYFNDTDSVANGGLDLYPHQGIGFDEHYNEAITMGDINNNPSTSFRVFRTADTTDFASLPISASDWFDFNSRPIFFLKPKTDPSDITSNFGLFVIKNLLRPFGYADGQEVSPDAIKEWSDDTNFFNMASNDNGNANAIIDDNIVQHYQNPLEPLNPFTTVSASSYISAITYGMKIGDSNKWGGGSGANVSSLFYNNNHTAVVGDGTYSATEAISSELEGHDVGLTSVVCKAVGLYTISGRITLPRDGLKSIRILKWVKSDIDVDGNGDDVIQVPEIVYNASFSETQSIINIDTSFFVENANDEIFMSLVGVYEEAVDASVSAIRDVLPNQWQSDYLHIAYKGYTAESQAWANYNGISSSNS